MPKDQHGVPPLPSSSQSPQRPPSGAMIGARAARILEGISTVASSASAAARVATLTPEQRQARWRCVVLKLLWIFRALGMKTATTAAIGVNAYRAIVEGVRSGEKPTPEVFRIFQGEGVGKPLAPATEGGPVQPDMCRHLELVRRGNKTSKWSRARAAATATNG
jgi:hypothetical protein